MLFRESETIELKEIVSVFPYAGTRTLRMYSTGYI